MAARIEAPLPPLSASRVLVDKFSAVARNGTPTERGAWLVDAETSMVASFARITLQSRQRSARPG